MLKEYLGYLSGEMAYKALNLFFFYVLVSELSSTEYALYGLLLANITLYSIFVRFGLHGALERFYHEKDNDFGLYLGSVLIIYIFVILSFLFSSFILYSTALNIYGKLELALYNINEMYLLVIAISAMSFFFDISLSFFNTSKKIKFYNFIRLYNLSGILLITFFLYYLNFTTLIYAYLFAMLIQYTLIAVFVLVYYYKNYNIRYEKGIIKEVAYFAIPLLLNHFASFIIIHINKFILNEYSDAESVARITFITNVTVIIESLLFVFNITWLPNFYKYMNLQDNVYIHQMIKKALLLFMMLYGLYAINTNIIIHIISGGKYSDTAFMAAIYAVSILFGFIYTYYVQYLFYLKKTSMLLRITLVGAFVGLILNYSLIVKFGLWGAVVAYVMIKVLIAIFAYFQVKKIYNQIVGFSYMAMKVVLMFIAILIIKLLIYYLAKLDYLYLSYLVDIFSSAFIIFFIFKIYGFEKLNFLVKYIKKN